MLHKGAGMCGGCINSLSLFGSRISDTECKRRCGVFLNDIINSNVFENNYGDLIGSAM